MADLTHYTIGLNTEDDQTIENFEKELDSISGYPSTIRVGKCSNAIKWYDHLKHVKELSKKFKGVLIVISGRPEYSSDIWTKEFLDGKMINEYKAKIVTTIIYDGGDKEWYGSDLGSINASIRSLIGEDE